MGVNTVRILIWLGDRMLGGGSGKAGRRESLRTIYGLLRVNLA